MGDTEERTGDFELLHVGDPHPVPDSNTLRKQMEDIRRFQSVVKELMVEGLDYGVIPGVGGKSGLFKAGAEKISKILGLSDHYIIVDRQETWETPGFFRYIIKCELRSMTTGHIVSEGLGECNSMESKYRWRQSKRICPFCKLDTIIKGKEEYGGGWLCFTKKGGCGAKFLDGDATIEGQSVGQVENDDIYSQVNTLLKMAAKRSLVDAALHAGRLSDLFTQDIEDLPREALTNNAPAETTKETKPEAVKDVAPKTLGELLTLCAKNSINKAKFLEHLGATTTEGMDVAAAYEVIKEYFPAATK